MDVERGGRIDPLQDIDEIRIRVDPVQPAGDKKRLNLPDDLSPALGPAE